MDQDSVIATTTIEAPPERVFAVLADPTTHAAIDGTGWVRESVDGAAITAAGQVFRIAMYHPNHPDGDYEMANLVTVFDAPRAIGWKPGQGTTDDELGFGEWTWRYDLAPVPEGTAVTLTYDWSQVSDEIRARIGFPPFPPEHLDRSLAHLADLARA